MSRTLKLVDHIFARSQQLQDAGRSREACKLLKSLEAFRNLPPETVAESQLQLATLYLKHRKFIRARKALTIALKLQPNNARLHFLKATALSACKNPNYAKALVHFRRSLDLEPDQPECLAKCGLLEIRLGRKKMGLEHCRRAAALAPDDLETIRLLVQGFRLGNQPQEARKLLLTARFRNARDSRYEQLWNRDRFQQVRKNQQLATARFVTSEVNYEPVILAFTGNHREEPAASKPRKVIRQDQAGEITAPRGILRVLRLDQKHAQ